jgi:hypothetical protein
MKALLATLIVDLLISVAILFLERDVSSTQIHSYGEALYWTTTQLTTLSSPLPNPLTPAGQVLAVVVDVFAITVVSTLAGMFSAFFHRSHEEYD